MKTHFANGCSCEACLAVEFLDLAGRLVLALDKEHDWSGCTSACSVCALIDAARAAIARARGSVSSVADLRGDK